MKVPVLRQLAYVCLFLFTVLNVFQIGAHYGASSYRALSVPLPGRQAFTQIGVDQSRTMLVVAIVAFGFALLSAVLLLIDWRRTRKVANLEASLA